MCMHARAVYGGAIAGALLARGRLGLQQAQREPAAVAVGGRGGARVQKLRQKIREELRDEESHKNAAQLV